MIKQAGAPRVSDDAARTLAAALEIQTAELVVEAHKIAMHANRRTVIGEDVKLARKVMDAQRGRIG